MEVRQQGLRRALSLLGWAALFAVVAVRVTRAFGPRTSRIPGFSSDSALPVLMSNASEWSLFDVYYWGQDRFGAWPFLLARAARALFGISWTDLSFHAWLTVWALLGVCAVALLAKGFRTLAAGLFATVVLFHPTRWALFELAQVYAWQITALLLAWCCLRALQSTRLPAREVGLGALASAASFLAVWSSTVSGPLLAVAAGMEALRSKSLEPERALRWRWMKPLVPVLLGVAGEAVLRDAYHRYAGKRFGEQFRTSLHIDSGHLGDNARAVFQHLLESRTVFLLALGLVGTVIAAVTLLRALRARTSVDAPLSVEAAVLIATTWILAFSHLPLLTLLNHVRLNEYNGRYFAPLHIFAAFAAGLTAASLLFALPQLRGARRQLTTWAGAALLLVVPLLLPSGEQIPSFEDLHATATRLSQSKPGRPLVGGYWDTYVFAGLQPPEQMTPPVPAEGDSQRTFWWATALKDAEEVVGVLPAGTQPAAWMYQYGALLQLKTPQLDAGAGRTFALYRTTQNLLRPTTFEPALSQWDFCRQGPLRISFAPMKQAQVYFLRKSDEFTLRFTAQPVLEDGTTGEETTFTSVRRTFRAEVSSAGPNIIGLSIRLSGAQPGRTDEWQCGLESAVVAELPPSA